MLFFKLLLQGGLPPKYGTNWLTKDHCCQYETTWLTKDHYGQIWDHLIDERPLRQNMRPLGWRQTTPGWKWDPRLRPLPANYETTRFTRDHFGTNMWPLGWRETILAKYETSRLTRDDSCQIWNQSVDERPSRDKYETTRLKRPFRAKYETTQMTTDHSGQLWDNSVNKRPLRAKYQTTRMTRDHTGQRWDHSVDKRPLP